MFTFIIDWSEISINLNEKRFIINKLLIKLTAKIGDYVIQD